MNGGTLTLTNTIISNNTADAVEELGHTCGRGGGIKNVGDGVLSISDSTISDNFAQGHGAGIKGSCGGTITLVNCTISSNDSGGLGGGIYVMGSVALTHSTLADNSAVGRLRFGASPVTNSGGGVYLRSGVLDLTHTIIAGSSIGSEGSPGGDCAIGEEGQIGINENNLIEDGSCDSAFSGDPLLNTLADYGGSTPTRTLLPGSPALDAIPADQCGTPIDQRGIPRPQGTACDIGAVEQ
jgi:hypothetical protein